LALVGGRTSLLITILMLIVSVLIVPVCYGEDYVLVDSKPRLPLIVNGRDVSELPVKAPPGSEVCVQKTTAYVDVDRRYVFKGWSSGENSTCIRVGVKETVTAYYVEEVLVQIYSRDVKRYSNSFWVRVGELVELKVDPVYYVGQDTRYVFEEWSGGEKPFSPNNTIVAVRPVKVEVKWVKEYFLRLVPIDGVKVNGSGWYREGSLAVISAPEEVNDGVRKLVFDGWISIGPYPVMISNPRSHVTAVVVNAPYWIMPIYNEFYLVEVYGLGGMLEDRRWVGKGELYKVNLKSIIEVVPGEVRYVFKGWRNPELPQSPSIQIEVNKPMVLEALYEKQFHVAVYSDYGSSGGGWYPENSTAIIRAPETPQTILFMKRVLSGWSGDVYNAEIDGGMVVLKSIKQPLKLYAVYSIQPDYPMLAIFFGIISVLLFIGLRKKEKKVEKVEVVEEVISEQLPERY